MTKISKNTQISTLNKKNSHLRITHKWLIPTLQGHSAYKIGANGRVSMSSFSRCRSSTLVTSVEHSPNHPFS